MRLLLALLPLLVACKHPIVVPPFPKPPAVKVEACAKSTPMPSQADVCDKKFSDDNLACVRCAVPAPCLYEPAVVLCVPTCLGNSCHAVGSGGTPP